MSLGGLILIIIMIIFYVWGNIYLIKEIINVGIENISYLAVVVIAFDFIDLIGLLILLFQWLFTIKLW